MNKVIHLPYSPVPLYVTDWLQLSDSRPALYVRTLRAHPRSTASDIGGEQEITKSVTSHPSSLRQNKQLTLVVGKGIHHKGKCFFPGVQI